MSPKKYLVLGTGVGKAIAYLLAKSTATELVAIGDIDEEKTIQAYRFINRFARSKRSCVPILFDAEKNQNPVKLFKQFDVVISALPAKYNLKLAEVAIKADVHFCDLGGVVEVTKKMLELNRKYPNTPVSIVPDCGLMPGLGIMLAKKLMQDLGGAEAIEILVGGLPQRPQPPIFYQKVFHSEGLKHICYDLAPILYDGKIVLVKPFHDYCQLIVLELQQFSDRFNGRIEAFVTAGASLAADSFRGWGVKYFSEKTVRWPGFVDFFKTVPADKFEQAIEEYLNAPINAENPDLVWMRVSAHKENRQKSISLLDLYDNETGLTAMQRTTGFTTAVIAEMMAEEKTRLGVNTPENAFDCLNMEEVLDRIGHFLVLKQN